MVELALERLSTVSKTTSHTTRMPRPGEVDGQDYFFVSREQFEKGIQESQFIEHAQVYGHLYGTSKQAIDAIHAQGKDAILVIENQGARELLKHFKHVTLILIKPPSLDELERRLKRRAKSDSDNISLRLKQAQQELKDMSWYQHVLINDDIDSTVQALVSLIRHVQTQR